MKKFNPAYKVTLYIKINFKASHTLKALPSGFGFSDFVLNCKVPHYVKYTEKHLRSENEFRTFSKGLTLPTSLFLAIYVTFPTVSAL